MEKAWNRGAAALRCVVALGLLMLGGTRVAAARPTATLWANAVDTVDGWDFEGQAAGNPGCTDPCSDCNDGNETYAVNPFPQTPSSREVAYLNASSFQSFTLPAGNWISGVRVDVLGRYNSGDRGQVHLEFQIPGLGTTPRDSIVFNNSTQCTYLMRQGGRDDITSLAGCGWTDSMINGMQVRVRRIRDGADTNLRIKAFRIQVDYQPAAQMPTSVTASPNPVCPGGSVVLSAAGGSGTTLEWHEGDCNGPVVGTGSQVTINSVTAPTTYYARWVDACTQSPCGMVTVGLVALPTPPTDIIPSSPACRGQPMTLTAVGGSGTTLEWLTGGCDGTVVSTENPYHLTAPDNPTTYYARWRNGCGVSGCATELVSPIGQPHAPTGINVDPAMPCPAQFMTLTAIGGDGDLVEWSIGTCDGVVQHMGSPWQLPAPSVPTTYFAHWRNSCGTSGCASRLVTPGALAVAPTSVVITPASACPGDTITLTAQGGAGDTLQWFRNDCSGSPFATGNNVQVAAQAVAETFLARWTNTCGPSACTGRLFEPLSPPDATPGPSQTSRPGEEAVLCVTGVGSGPLAYSWYRGSDQIVDGGRYSGATTNCLHIADVETGDEGDYCAHVAGACAPEDVACVHLDVTPCFLQIVTQPPAMVEENSPWPITICLAAAGEGELMYQWRHDDVDLPDGGRYAGVHSPCLTINSTEPDDSGVYDARVTDSCGTVLSHGSSVRVYCPADFNRDGIVNSQDFFSFLTALFEGSDPSDFNRDGNRNSQDLFDFLTVFFRPCP